MLKLLVTDYKRILKDKLFLVICIIGLAFALFTPLLYKVLFSSLQGEGMDDLLSMYVSAKQILFSSFSLTNNFGLILPIFLMIIVCKDFNQGTIRNKVICGHSRTKIFLSIFISCATIMCATILLYALIQFFISLLLFDYSPEGFNKKEVGYLLKSISLDLLVYIFVSALISFLCVFMKNVGMSIVSYFGIVVLMLAVVSILSVVILFVPESSQGLKNFYQFLLDINFLNHTTVIGLGEYAKYQELKIFLSDLIGIGAFVGFGVLAFNKKDLK